MEVESSTDIMAFLMEKLKPDNPWVPSRSWDSRPLILTLLIFSTLTSTVSESSLMRLVMNALLGVESALITIDKLSAVLCYMFSSRNFSLNSKHKLNHFASTLQHYVQSQLSQV